MTEWVKRHGYWTARQPTRPGIYRLQDGGYLIRSRIDNPAARVKTGKRKRKAVVRALKDATLDEAVIAQAQLKQTCREAPDVRPQSQFFENFALSRFRAKVQAGDIKSAKGREKWEGALRLHILRWFGHRRCDAIRAWHCTEWRTELARMMVEGYESSRTTRSGNVTMRRVLLLPWTANTWIGIARTLFREMAEILELTRDPAAALALFDTSEDTYTE